MEPLNHYLQWNRRVVLDWTKLKLPEDQWGPLIRPCYKAPFHLEARMCERLLESNMGVLVAEHFSPRISSGKLLVGCFLSFPKDANEDCPHI